MVKPFVHIENLSLSYQRKVVLDDLSWQINPGENWVIGGKSGSGKTSLAKAIAGQIPFQGDIKFNYNLQNILPQQTLFVESWYQFKNLEGVANFYYQQRYTSLQAKDTLTVHAELVAYGKEHGLHLESVEQILTALSFSNLASSQLIELSSGEHKKLQLVKALWLKPQLLIIDQPYTGLDASSRQKLNQLLDEVVEEGVQLILISNDLELPTCINAYSEINNGKLVQLHEPAVNAAEIHAKSLPDFLSTSPIYNADEVVHMVDVNISYGEKEILKHINWIVKPGERWLLQGPNGSGKSTLLSLVNGDHPQSYANTLYLFGKRRGSGESVWEIKQHIGLISPEFHWYFDPSATVWQSIASGFYDTSGLYQQLPYSKKMQVDELIEYFGLTTCKNDLLNSLPLGKQRLALLARTIIKNPELLILDEPCQGLDHQQTQHFNQLVDELCANGMTLIYVGHFESQLPKRLTHQLILNHGEVIKNSKLYELQNEIAS